MRRWLSATAAVAVVALWGCGGSAALGRQPSAAQVEGSQEEGPDAPRQGEPASAESLAVNSEEEGASQGSLLVVIDPGHGGDKDGAIGPNLLKEKDAALAIALALRRSLEALGHRCLLTREDDSSVGLRERTALANEAGADVFVSIHLNSLPLGPSRRRVSGIETYFLSAEASDADAAALAHAENSDDPDAAQDEVGDPLDAILEDLVRTEAHADSSLLAYRLHSELLLARGSRDRGVRQAPFLVLRGARMPAVLVEVGFLSHPEEAERLADPGEQERIGEALAQGLDRFGMEVIERRLEVRSGHPSSPPLLHER